MKKPIYTTLLLSVLLLSFNTIFSQNVVKPSLSLEKNFTSNAYVVLNVYSYNGTTYMLYGMNTKTIMRTFKIGDVNRQYYKNEDQYTDINELYVVSVGEDKTFSEPKKIPLPDDKQQSHYYQSMASKNKFYVVIASSESEARKNTYYLYKYNLETDEVKKMKVMESSLPTEEVFVSKSDDNELLCIAKYSEGGKGEKMSLSYKVFNRALEVVTNKTGLKVDAKDKWEIKKNFLSNGGVLFFYEVVSEAEMALFFSQTIDAQLGIDICTDNGIKEVGKRQKDFASNPIIFTDKHTGTTKIVNTYGVDKTTSDGYRIADVDETTGTLTNVTNFKIGWNFNPKKPDAPEKDLGKFESLIVGDVCFSPGGETVVVIEKQYQKIITSSSSGYTTIRMNYGPASIYKLDTLNKIIKKSNVEYYYKYNENSPDNDGLKICAVNNGGYFFAQDGDIIYSNNTKNINLIENKKEEHISLVYGNQSFYEDDNYFYTMLPGSKMATIKAYSKKRMLKFTSTE